MDSDYCLPELKPPSSSTLTDSTGFLDHNKSPVFKVKLEDHHRGTVKLEYINNLLIKEEMSYRSIHHCDECAYESKSIFFMLNHIRRHRFPSQFFNCASSNVELYCCKNCDINFESVVHLGVHIKEQHSTNEEMDGYPLKSYICSRCCFATSSALESLRHVRTGCLENNISSNTNTLKTVEKERMWFHCEKCTYKAERKCNLQRHILCKHTDDTDKMWFYCEKCPYKAAFKYKLKKHIVNKHRDDKNKKCSNIDDQSRIWFYCDKCTYRAKNNSHLKSHVMARHTEDSSRQYFYCEKCTFKATQKSNLKKHVVYNHADDKDKKWFYCEKCIYKTTHKGNFNKHIVIKHTDDNDKQWLHCDKCEYKAIQKCDINRHITAKHNYYYEDKK